MRVLDAVLAVLATIFGFASIIVLWDVFVAMDAVSCRMPGSGPHCYPWGAEGPVAGKWSYLSKENYILGRIGFVVLTTGAIGALIVGRRTKSAVARGVACVFLLLAAAVFWN
jgi:hypothetical protein